VYELTCDSGRGFDLDLSLFERLALQRRVPVYTLTTQRRMAPLIAEVRVVCVYSSRGNTHTRARTRVHAYTYAQHTHVDSSACSLSAARQRTLLR
jgi:hypothetical protein